jgi:hypothetical protein
VRHTLLAATAIAAGDLPLARREAAVALEAAPHHSPALLILACLAMEAGHAQEVETVTARLKAERPERPEPRLLERMWAHRQQAGTPWRQAFLDAWAELSHPDFSNSPLLPDIRPPAGEGLPNAWRAAASGPARLTLALTSRHPSEEQARWLLAQLPQLDDPAFVIAVEAVLDSEALPESLRAQAASELRRKRSQLADTHPHSMQLHLWRLLADTPVTAAFSARDLEALEAVAALPGWKPTSFAHTFKEARHHLRAAAVPNPGDKAFTVASLSIGSKGDRVLRKRAEATRSQLLPGARHRLGRILWNVGTRMAEQPTFVERIVGLGLMRKGAQDMQDDAAVMRIRALEDEAHHLLTAEQMAALDRWRWPLPSLQEEVLEACARDAWAHLHAFQGARGPSEEG